MTTTSRLSTPVAAAFSATRHLQQARVPERVRLPRTHTRVRPRRQPMKTVCCGSHGRDAAIMSHSGLGGGGARISCCSMTLPAEFGVKVGTDVNVRLLTSLGKQLSTRRAHSPPMGVMLIEAVQTPALPYIPIPHLRAELAHELRMLFRSRSFIAEAPCDEHLAIASACDEVPLGRGRPAGSPHRLSVAHERVREAAACSVAELHLPATE